MKRFVTAICIVLALAVSCRPEQPPVDDSVDLRPGVVSHKGLDAATTVYGVVSCGGRALEGVVVSDGFEVTATNADGLYQLPSKKSNGYVFISVPSGYRVASEGVIPKFFATLTGAQSLERKDFELVDDGDQTVHTMLFFGDIHLADRYNGDVGQFREFTNEVNEYIGKHKGEKIFAMTLGDMTWDTFWLSNHFAFDEYLDQVNEIEGLQIFHTIGNHDHEMEAAGDWDTVRKYKKKIGPNWYSFNVGKIHYISLDNIECTNPGDGSTKTYTQTIVSDELAWLKKDLAFVAKSTPVVVTMHSALYNDTGKFQITNGMEMLECFRGYDRVDFVDGHTHKMWNWDALNYSIHVFDHNSGAVCATWWWTDYFTPGIHISQDGTPGGYRIFKVDGKNFSWSFKPTGGPEDDRMRLYDRNSIDVSKLIPNANGTNRAEMAKWSADWSGTSSSNDVYVNIWDWDKDWKVTATEDGNPVSIVRIPNVTGYEKGIYDPLYLMSYVAKKLNSSKDASLSFTPALTKHMFRVKTSSPTSTVTVTATDRFGKTVTESIRRPCALTVDNYKY